MHFIFRRIDLNKAMFILKYCLYLIIDGLKSDILKNFYFLRWDHLVMEINWLQYLFQEFMVRSLCSVYFNPKLSQGIHVRSTQKKENMNNSFDKMVSISKLVAIYLLVQHPAVFLQKTRLLLQTLLSQYYILTHVTDT